MTADGAPLADRVTFDQVQQAVDRAAARIEQSFRSDLASLRGDVKDDLQGLGLRIDSLTEQVRQTNGQVTRHDEQLKNLAREVFRRRHDDPDPTVTAVRTAAALPEDVANRRITERDVKIVALAVGTTYGFFKWLVPLLQHISVP